MRKGGSGVIAIPIDKHRQERTIRGRGTAGTVDGSLSTFGPRRAGRRGLQGSDGRLAVLERQQP